jgi:threonine dehydratase
MVFEELISLDSIREARAGMIAAAKDSPLVRLKTEAPSPEIYLKLESLNPTGSFKLRGASNAIRLATKEQLERGVYTASSGNMAQAVAWNARRLGLDCRVVVPDSAPETKLQAVRRLGAPIIVIPFDEWWEILMGKPYEPLADRLFLHPSGNSNVMAGYGTIGLEILEALPEVDTVIIPWGSGGLCGGVGSVMRQLRPEVRVYAGEVDTGAPVFASLAAGRPVEVPYTPSFVDGISAPSLMAEMWPLATKVLDGSLVVTLGQVRAAVRFILQHNNLLAEGAGAAAAAAALWGDHDAKKVVCIITGGNLELRTLVDILMEEDLAKPQSR